MTHGVNRRDVRGASRRGDMMRKTVHTRVQSWLICMMVNLLFVFFPAACWALNPEQLLIVTNRKVPEGNALARYYMERRKVPSQNLIQLSTSKDESLSREDYDREIAAPVRDFLSKNDPEGKRFTCIVLMYGIPLRVGPPKLNADEKRQLADLQERRADLSNQITASGHEDEKAIKALRDKEAALVKEIQRVSKVPYGASVDSEIALVLEKGYDLDGWLPNRYFVGFQGKEIKNMPQRVLLVSRLDGPSETIVRRIIDDSIRTENEGLAGKAYFDARWPDPGEKKVTGYQLYDKAIHNAARIVEKSKKMPVVLDEKERLFQPGEAPDAALYCGWYSLAKYVDAFTWVRGAVGYHIASAECTTLKNKTSTVWCKMMLEKGVAATVGPVAEPYVQAFPLPDIFFGCIIHGQPTLAECYAASVPFWSWQMVLIGDPLYRPFKHQRANAR